MLGLHPHHLDEYSLRELLNKYKGFDRVQAANEIILRNVAYYSMFSPPKEGPEKVWKIDKSRLGVSKQKKDKVPIKVTKRGN